MIALLLTALPSPNFVVDHVDVIELNHKYSESTAGINLDQFIFWRDEHVVAWRAIHARADYTEADIAAFERRWIAKHATKRNPNPKPPAFVPEYVGPIPRKVGGRWVVVWHDGGVLRRVTAGRFYRTWTYCDPEIEDRKVVAMDKRANLTQPEKANGQR